MPAGECYGAVIFVHALASVLTDMTHVVVFTDSKATARALTCASSPAPQLNYLVGWLSAMHPGLQILGVWQPGKRNERADQLSRGAGASVMQEAQQAGMAAHELPMPEVAGSLLKEAMSRPLYLDALSMP